jgi:hypothetical protein
MLSHLLPKKVDYFPSCVHSKTWNYFISNRATNLVTHLYQDQFPKSNGQGESNNMIQNEHVIQGLLIIGTF